MEHIYFKLIQEGRRTIEQVPEGIRAKVQALMEDKENVA